MTIQFFALASLAATLIIVIALHHMKERSFVIWVHGLFLFWCLAPVGALAYYDLVAKGF